MAKDSPDDPVPGTGRRETAKILLGRHVFGWTAIVISIVSLVWHDVDVWHDLGGISHRAVLIDVAAAVEILGGLTIQWPRTARLGAVLLGGISFVFLLFCIPPIVAHPLVFNSWFDFFEVLSQVAAMLLVLGTVEQVDSARWPTIARIGYRVFGLCVVYYTLGQIVNFSSTAGAVPRWIPPGQMFWAVATTVAFGLAAVALLSGRFALLASRLLTAMLAGFALLVWLPALVSNPHSLFNWTECVQTAGIAAAAWIVADFLGQSLGYPSARSTEAENVSQERGVLGSTGR